MKKQSFRRSLILFCLIAALAVGIVSPAGMAIPGIGTVEAQAAEYRATSVDLNMRAGAGVNYKVVLAIPAGKQVEVLSKPGTWYKVKYAGKTGYVNSKYLRTYATKVMAEDLNMRSSRSTANRSNIIGVVKKGQTVSVVSIEANLWYLVSANGKTGYIKGGHFTDDKSRMTNKSSSSSTSKSIKATSTTSKGTKKTLAENLKMRSSMSKANDNNVIAIIPKGAKVTIKAKQSDNWYKVKYNKKTGYIKGGHFTDDKSRIGLGSIKPYNAVTKVSLNLRSSASAANRSNIILAIPAGKTLTVTGKEAGNWLKVKYNGKTGYVKNGYFK